MNMGFPGCLLLPAGHPLGRSSSACTEAGNTKIPILLAWLWASVTGFSMAGSAIPDPAPLRLVNGPNRCTGRVEVLHNQQWGTVCDDSWDLHDATVVCRQLGCGTALSAPGEAWFGQGSDNIWLDETNCTGTEAALSECRARPWGDNSCNHVEDAGVKCSGPADADTAPIRLVNGPSRCAGRVEVLYNQHWGSICDDSWDLYDARVVCRQLGCGMPLSAPVGARFGQGSNAVWLDDVHCIGTEAALSECNIRPWGDHNCNHTQDASVVCSDVQELQLVNGPNRCAGRVEVLHNHQWGTVCDHDWDLQDAGVVCRQLGCGTVLSAQGGAQFGRGSDPIWLDDLHCTGTEAALSECRARPWADNNCNLGEDAGVVCSDIDECQGPSPADCGPHTNCANVPGSYYCTCIVGYKPSSGKAKFTHASENSCHDIDECLGPNPADCGPHANCTNVPGNYSCSCIDGYKLSSGKANFTHASENSCQDIDECQGPSPAVCGPHANCANVPGNYYCTCIDGYEPSSGKAKFTHTSENSCQDIDECNNTPDICGPKTMCINTNGSYRCECLAGYVPSNGNTTLCKVPSIISSVQFVAIKETFRNFSLQGKRSSENSNFSSFFNSTFGFLLSTFGDGNATLSLENATLPFNSVLNSTSPWDSGDKWEVGSAVTVLLQSVELAALATALRSPERTKQNMMTESLAIQTRLVTGNCSQHSEDFTLSAHEETMDVRCDTITGTATQAGVGAVAFISYSTLDSIISARRLSVGNLPAGGKLEKSHLNSRVVSGAIGDGRPINLSSPANFTLRHKQESYPLTIITYVGLTLSLLCLFLAILTFRLCRSICNVSTSLHLQLCLCLFLADLLFLTAVTRPGSQVACAVIAGLLHYLFLACFSWMFLEGLHLFLTVRNLQVVNYTSTNWFKKRFMYPFGYGFPALVVAISAAVNPGGYGTSTHCWLSLDRGFRWSFMGPVCAIILINITFFVLTLWILRNRLSSLNADVSTLRDHRLLTFKAIAQLFILGCSWILGLLQVGPAATVMAYLFTIVNSLLGAFIFLVHCLLNRQVTEEYRRWIRGFRTSSTKSQMSDLSMSAVPTTSTKMVRGPLLCSSTSL